MPAALQPQLLQHQPPELDWRFLLPWWKGSGRRFACELREVAADVNVDLDDALTVSEFVRHARLGHGQCSVPARLLQRLPVEGPLTCALAVFDHWDSRRDVGLFVFGESGLSELFHEIDVESPACLRAERAPTLGTKAHQEAGPQRTKAPTATAGADNRRAASMKKAPRSRAFGRPAAWRLSHPIPRRSGQGAPNPPWLRAWAVLLGLVAFQEKPPPHRFLKGGVMW